MSAGEAGLQLHVARIEQLFDSLDPTPFRERDLDPRAEAYIVGWAPEHRRRTPLRVPRR